MRIFFSFCGSKSALGYKCVSEIIIDKENREIQVASNISVEDRKEGERWNGERREEWKMEEKGWDEMERKTKT